MNSKLFRLQQLASVLQPTKHYFFSTSKTLNLHKDTSYPILLNRILQERGCQLILNSRKNPCLDYSMLVPVSAFFVYINGMLAYLQLQT